MLTKVSKENQKFLDKYLSICETSKGLTKKTIKGFSYDIRLFLRFIGNKPLSEVTHHDCEDFMVYCHKDRKNGSQALNRKFTDLNGFFKELIRKDYIDMKNPMDKLDKPKIKKKLRPHLTYEEIQKVFQYLEDKKDLRTLAMVSLFFYSGIRLSELHQLNRDSLDFNTLQFSVIGKGNVQRNCIFSPYAAAKLKEYLATRTDNHEALFYSRESNRLSHRQIQLSVKNVIKKSIARDMSPHNLRHSCGMYLLHSGIPLDKIQKVLGHMSISTTQIYAHNTIDDVQEIVNEVWQ